ncbi:hypothetical protein HDU84_002049 [Entophlyctis sp. JEL0112]|nr:hypothetical protein HDU84_002049 [Entophlyctis sp. JEL0112]
MRFIVFVSILFSIIVAPPYVSSDNIADSTQTALETQTHESYPIPTANSNLENNIPETLSEQNMVDFHSADSTTLDSPVMDNSIVQSPMSENVASINVDAKRDEVQSMPTASIVNETHEDIFRAPYTSVTVDNGATDDNRNFTATATTSVYLYASPNVSADIPNDFASTDGTNESQLIVDKGLTVDEDDGVDVRVLENIMAKAVEVALGDTESALSKISETTEDFLNQSGPHDEVIQNPVPPRFTQSNISEAKSVKSNLSETELVDTILTGLNFSEIQPAPDGPSDFIKHPANEGQIIAEFDRTNVDNEEMDSDSSVVISSDVNSSVETLGQFSTQRPHTTYTTNANTMSESQDMENVYDEVIDMKDSEVAKATQNATSPETMNGTFPLSNALPKATQSIPVSRYSKKEERFNHASFDCGALILSSNPGASSATSILVKSKDQYMLNRCKNIAKGETAKSSSGANYVIIELCDTIKIDTLVLANFEYFSSTFKEFNVYIAEQYPPKRSSGSRGWLPLGSFVASNVREFQYFKVIDPLIFTRYLKIEFLSYHGFEYYCPLTQVKVFGKTEIEEFREEEELIAAELAKDEEVIRAVARLAVKEIEAVAPCPGEGCNLEAANGKDLSPFQAANVSHPGNGVAREEIAGAAQTQTPEQKSDERIAYNLSADYFQLFMEKEQLNSSTDSSSKEDVPQTAAPIPTTMAGTSQESIFKTMAKRIALLERNSSLSFKFIEEQSHGYHAAFQRLESARVESNRNTLGECNKTITRVVRDLAKDYETAWTLLLRDLEKQRRVSEDRVKELEKSLEKLSERMTRQIFYDAVMVILLVLLLIRIFTPANTLETPLVTPHVLRKSFPPYFRRNSPASDHSGNHEVPNIESAFAGHGNLHESFGPLLDNDDDHLERVPNEDSEDLSSPDDNFYAKERIVESLAPEDQVSHEREQMQDGPSTRQAVTLDVAKLRETSSPVPYSAESLKSETSKSVRLNTGSALPKSKESWLSSSAVRSMSATPSLATGFSVSVGGTSHNALSLKKKRRRRSLAGLRLQSQSESIQMNAQQERPQE